MTRRPHARLVVAAALVTAVAVSGASCSGGDATTAPAPSTGTQVPAEVDVFTPGRSPVPWGPDPAGGAAEEPTTDEAADTTLYVSPDGDDAADGQTTATAWATLEAAMGRAAPGQTVYVLDGTYTNDVAPNHYTVSLRGRPDAWITFRAHPGATPRIEVSSGTAVLLYQAAYVELDGFEITGVGFDATNNFGYGVVITESHHVRVRNNTVSGFPVGGIGSQGSTHMLIEGNVVSGNSAWSGFQGSGISIWQPDSQGLLDDEAGYSNYVLGNVVRGNENLVTATELGRPDDITDGNGIIIDEAHVTGYPNRTLVANNVVFDNGGKGVQVFLSSNVDVIHNTLYQNGRTADLAGGPAELGVYGGTNVRFLNNLVWARPGVPVWKIEAGGAATAGGNVLVGDRAEALDAATDRVVADPGLRSPTTDPATADFRPAPGSPAIDAGRVELPRLLDADVDGRPRVAGASPDAGAYEAG